MTVDDLIKMSQSMPVNIRSKEIVIRCPNDLLVEPSIKYSLKNELDVFNMSSNNIEKLVITWE